MSIVVVPELPKVAVPVGTGPGDQLLTLPNRLSAGADSQVAFWADAATGPRPVPANRIAAALRAARVQAFGAGRTRRLGRPLPHGEQMSLEFPPDMCPPVVPRNLHWTGYRLGSAR